MGGPLLNPLAGKKFTPSPRLVIIIKLLKPATHAGIRQDKNFRKNGIALTLFVLDDRCVADLTKGQLPVSKICLRKKHKIAQPSLGN